MLALALVLSLSSSTTSPPTPWSTGESRGEDLSIKVVTFGPGDDIAEWFGHGALVVEDTRLHQSRLYNYGEYAFDETVARRYAMGRLEFSVGERPVERTLQLYAGHDRDVRIAVLALSPAQRLQIATLLADNVRPENRNYLYDHYSDNCTTRVRDLVDVVTGGQLQAQSRPGSMTLRQLTRRQTAVSTTMGFVIDLILNDSTDQPLSTWQEAFLPEEFEKQLMTATIIDETGASRPLVQTSTVWWKSTRSPLPPPASSWFFFGVGAVIAVVVFAVSRRRVFGVVVAFVGVVFGVFGAALFFMANFTDHHVTFGNENLWLVNPMTLLLVPTGLLVAVRDQRQPLVLVATVLVTAGLVAIGGKAFGFDQDNARVMGLVLPVLLAIAAGARRQR